MTAVLTEVKIWTQTGIHTCTGRTPCKDEGRVWGDAFISQEMPKMASKLPGAGEKGWNRFFLTTSEGINSADTPISDFRPP